jgi:hypothetical protein
VTTRWLVVSLAVAYILVSMLCLHRESQLTKAETALTACRDSLARCEADTTATIPLGFPQDSDSLIFDGRLWVSR